MLIAILCLCFFGYLFWSKILKASEDSPPKLSYIECMKICLYNSDLWSSFLYLCDSTRKIGGVAYGSLGMHTIYTISDPEDCLTVLKSCPDKAFLYDFWKPWLGEGLFTGSAQINKHHRKFFLPMMSQKNLDSYVNEFNKNANRFVSKMAPSVGEQSFDILRDLLITNMELFCGIVLYTVYRYSSELLARFAHKNFPIGYNLNQTS